MKTNGPQRSRRGEGKGNEEKKNKHRIECISKKVPIQYSPFSLKLREFANCLGWLLHGAKQVPMIRLLNLYMLPMSTTRSTTI